MGTMLFEVRGLAKRFGRIQALADVGFQVRAGEVLGLIGPNGAGKSTSFECLAGVLPSNGGQVLRDGHPVADEVVEQMDLRQLLDQPIGTLSKGQRKRALLAIGLLTRQPALLIDEPFERR